MDPSSTVGAQRRSFLTVADLRKKSVKLKSLKNQSSNGVLHHIAGISLFPIKDHILLMELGLIVMSLYPARLHNNRIVRARWITSDRRPSFVFSGLSCCVRITQGHTGDDQRSLTPASAAPLVLFAGILMAFASRTREINSGTIQGMLAGSVVKPFADDGVCIVPRGSVKQNLLIDIHRKWLATVKGLLGPRHDIVIALELLKAKWELEIVYIYHYNYIYIYQ